MKVKGMTVQRLTSIPQNYCHEGGSLDEVEIYDKEGTQKVGFKNPSAVRIFGRDFARIRSEDFQSNGTLKQVYIMKECPGVKVYKERRVLKEAVTGRKLGISYTITVAKNGSRPATFVQSVTTDINSARAIEAKVKALAKSRNR